MDKIDIYQKLDGFKKYKKVNTEKIIDHKVIEPYFSIIIPTYKRTETLRAAIKSALEQREFEDYEILIISNDPNEREGENLRIISEFSCEKIAYYVNEENIGLCGNWNRAVELAQGKYIVMLHDDDILSEYCLTSIYKAILKFEEPGIIGVGYQIFTQNDIKEFQEPKNIKYRKVTKKSYFFGKYINITGMTFRKDLAITIGGFIDEYYPNEDSIFIYQGLLVDKVINIENILAGYRISLNASLSKDTMKKIILLTEQTRRSIAQYELFARAWLKLFDIEFFYQYVDSANKHWGLNIEFEEMCVSAKINNNKFSKIRYYIMRMFLKMLA